MDILEKLCFASETILCWYTIVASIIYYSMSGKDKCFYWFLLFIIINCIKVVAEIADSKVDRYTSIDRKDKLSDITWFKYTIVIISSSLFFISIWLLINTNPIYYLRWVFIAYEIMWIFNVMVIVIRSECIRTCGFCDCIGQTPGVV
jgi:hypothetical protein